MAKGYGHASKSELSAGKSSELVFVSAEKNFEKSNLHFIEVLKYTKTYYYTDTVILSRLYYFFVNNTQKMIAVM